MNAENNVAITKAKELPKPTAPLVGDAEALLPVPVPVAVTLGAPEVIMIPVVLLAVMLATLTTTVEVEAGVVSMLMGPPGLVPVVTGERGGTTIPLEMVIGVVSGTGIGDRGFGDNGGTTI